MKASFLPGQKTVAQKLSKLKKRAIDISTFKTLTRGKIYIIELQEKLSLPDNISAVANAKSSTGRLDILTRLISTNQAALIALATVIKEKCMWRYSISFQLLSRGIMLNQLRFHNQQKVITDGQLVKLNSKFNIVENITQIDNGITISVNLESKKGNPLASGQRIASD